MLSLTLIAVLLACGVVAGFLAGLLGVGGGLVIVPVVVGVLDAAALGGNHVQHLAVGTSLAVMVFTSFASVRAHHKKGAVNWAIVRGMAPAMMLGTFAGSLLAGWIPSNALRWFFVIYAYAIGAQMFFGATPTASREMPGFAGQSAAGGVIGMVSSWVGIGGGSMSVPFMGWCNVPMHSAIATSAALGWPIAVSGALGYLTAGWQTPGLPWVTLLLGTSPGGITEMAITAKVLQLGVPVVTAFQVCRLVAVLILVAPLFDWLERKGHLT